MQHQFYPVVGKLWNQRRKGRTTYSTSWSTDQHVLAGVVSHGINQTLHSVEGLIFWERSPAKTIHFGDLDKFSAFANSTNFGSWYGILLVSLFCRVSIYDTNKSFRGLPYARFVRFLLATRTFSL